MQKNKKALSLVLAIGLTLVMSLLALFILDYIVPFSKQTKQIEQSVVAYYKADSAIEDALYFLNNNSLWSEKHKNFSNSKIDYKLDIISSWSILPPSQEGNSEFNKDYNIIKVWEPIQLEIWYNKINPNNFKIYFKVPDLDYNSLTEEKLVNTSSWIINWQLNAQNNTLNSSWSYIKWSEICNSNNTCSEIILWWRAWRDLQDNLITFSNFYTNNCWTWKSCILKLSVINELKGQNDSWININIPYLEWKIDAGSNIPLRYRIIKAKWRAYWFEKSLKVRIPQKTTNEAYDFTVFQ